MLAAVQRTDISESLRLSQWVSYLRSKANGKKCQMRLLTFVFWYKYKATIRLLISLVPAK
jgi:hypothetical protein